MKDEYETKMSQIRSSEVAEKNDLQFKYDNMNSKYTNIKKFHEQVNCEMASIALNS